MQKFYFTSESVTEGHPDKICDQVSDAILDEIIKNDPNARVAIEALTKKGFIVIAGEITTNTYVNIQQTARNTIKKIGYNNPAFGFDYETSGVLTSISEQSDDIAAGVDSEGNNQAQGAGDQGIMSGYACTETPELMPLPIMLAHRLTKRLAQVRKDGIVKSLRPDGKAQVTVEYNGSGPVRVDAVVLSSHHAPGIDQKDFRIKMMRNVIQPICSNWIDAETSFHINPTGRFAKGGPVVDAGVTGRKIIVDTYGGIGSHGGGAFSGKDPSKVDRSAAYMARHIAKNIVAADLADECEVQIGYAIGVAKPVSLYIKTYDSAKVEIDKIIDAVKDIFPLKPGEIIDYFDLKRPIYLKTACYGHFGWEKEGYPWEKKNKVEELKNYINYH